ncbi:MAG: RelA/SpoT family protein [Dehalococcoidia bacterium]
MVESLVWKEKHTESAEGSGLARLREKARRYLPPGKLAQVEEAYNFALECHQGQWRESGDPFMEHPLETALTLLDLHLDSASVAAGLLHDVPEDCGVPLKDIEARFGAEVGKLVDGCTKLTRLSLTAEKRATVQGLQAENLRKMLMAMAEDLRVVFIRLADRLHNMRTLQALPPQKRTSIARETLEVYAPLAHRLGIWELKWQLEDLAFACLESQKYRHIAKMIASRSQEREDFVAQVIETLKGELFKAGLKAQVNGRSKHIYSIHQKLEKYGSQGKDFSDILDLVAIRVVVDTVSDCYSALGVIHSLWRPLTGEFNDYIANPKENGYQSLHTTVWCQGTIPLEIQVRTHEMHRICEYGVAAHWRYKEGRKVDIRFEDRIAWLRQLVEWQKEFSGAEEFIASVKADIFKDQVFVYTPKGEIKELPAGSTPLDFAYRIHTDLGHRCIGAKVNGRLVSLNRELQNGDTVEIRASKTARGPSRDWLNPHLGFVSTSQAREKIRQWFKRQERQDNIERGRQLLEKEVKRLGLSLGNQEELARLFKFESVDDLLAAIGYGGITLHQVAQKLASEQEKPRVVADKPPSARAVPRAVEVQGVGDLLTSMANCCHPLPGDEIIGYITRNRGITVHRRDCHSVAHEDEKERFIEVSWGSVDQLYPVTVKIDAWDRMGLLRDISAVVAEEKINIAAVSASEHGDQTSSVYLTLEIKSMAQLSRLLSKIDGIRGVTSVVRSTE